jgi:hypothetical protein
MRAPPVRHVRLAAAVDWRARTGRVLRAVPAAVADVFVVALAIVFMAADAWLLAAVFGVRL